MISFIFLIALFQPAQFACSTFEKGTYTDFDNSTKPEFVCNNGLINYGSVQFKKPFCGIPKIVISQLSYSTAYEASYKFKFLTQTETEFSFSLQCDGYDVFAYVFSWLALIDDRIWVINDLMDGLPLPIKEGYTDISDSYPLSHEGCLDCQISTQILSSSAQGARARAYIDQIGFHFLQEGDWSHIGVQLVYAPKSVYQWIENYMVQSIPVSIAISPLPGQIPLICFTIAIPYINFAQCKINIDGFTCEKKGIQQNMYILYIGYFIFDFAFKPHYYSKIRVSQMMCLDHNVMNTFKVQKLQLKENNLSFSDDDTVEIAPIEFENEELSLIYFHSCQPNRIIAVTILRNGKDGSYNYTTSKYCHRGFNLLTIYIYLYQSRVGPSELSGSLSSKGLSFQQKMDDSGITYQLVNIEF